MALGGLILAVSAFAAAGINSDTALRSTQKQGQRFIQSLKYKHTLRVCNAYPLHTSLDVFVGNGGIKLTPVEPMAYQECRDFNPVLHEGDRVDFKTGMAADSAGTFTIGELPEGDAVLLLVIYRHDTFTSAVSFQSHVFSGSTAAQIAVLDTYKGKKAAKVHIQDTSKPKDSSEGSAKPPTVRDEVLRYNSVVAILPGKYAVDLQQAGFNATEANKELVALPNQAYVVVRVGIEAEEGESYPEDLIIFPRSDPQELGAARRGAASAVGTLLAAALLSVAGGAGLLG